MILPSIKMHSSNGVPLSVVNCRQVGIDWDFSSAEEFEQWVLSEVDECGKIVQSH